MNQQSALGKRAKIRMSSENVFGKYDREGAYHHQLMSSDQFYIAKINKALSFVKSGLVVYDIGCGDGVFVKYAKEMGAILYGIDNSPKGIKFTKIFSGCENLCVGSANSLPLSPSSADLILMIDVINYVKDYRGAVNEAMRALKPKGSLIIMSPCNIDLEMERAEIPDSWQKQICTIEDLREVFENDIEIAEISFIYKPLPINLIKNMIRFIRDVGFLDIIIRVVAAHKRLYIESDNKKGGLPKENGDIYLNYYNIPKIFIKKYEPIEYILVVKRAF